MLDHILPKKTIISSDAAKEHDFLIMNWSPNWTDLNPIEYLWDHIKWELHQHYLPGSSDTDKNILKDWLMKIWWSIGHKDQGVNDLIDSLPVVIEVRG